MTDRENFIQEQTEKAKDPFALSRYFPFVHACPDPQVAQTPWCQDTVGPVFDAEGNTWLWAIDSVYYPNGMFDDSGWREYFRPAGTLQWRDNGVRVTADMLSTDLERPYHRGLWGGCVYVLSEEEAALTKYPAGTVVYLPTAANSVEADGRRLQNIFMATASKLGVAPGEFKLVVKNPGPPLTDSPFWDFRDGRIYFDKEHQQFVMSVSVSYGVAFYVSKNLDDWSETYTSVWVKPGAIIGQNQGLECPSIVNLGSKQVLVYSDQAADPECPIAQIGHWDGKSFISLENVPPQKLGFGPDDYAQSTSVPGEDGRVAMVSWMNNWLYCGNAGTPFDTPYRGFKNVQSWVSYLTLNDQEDKVLVAPEIPEDNAKTIEIEAQTLGKYPSFWAGGDAFPIFTLPEGFAPGRAFFLELTLKPVVKGNWPSTINLNLHNYIGREAAQYFFSPSASTGQYFRGLESIKPTNLNADMNAQNAWNNGYNFPLFFQEDGSMKIYMVVDTSSTELYFEGGTMAFRALDFPIEQAQGIAITASWEAEVEVSGKVTPLVA